MAKRIKINFETVNGDNYEIIPPEDIAKTNERIKREMKEFKKRKKMTLHERLMEHIWDTQPEKMKNKQPDDVVIMGEEDNILYFGIVGYRGWFKTDMNDWKK